MDPNLRAGSKPGPAPTTGSSAEGGAWLILPTGEQWALDRPELTVGRARDNDLCLQDPSVSRYHARFLYVDGRPAVLDLNSSNGTIVNGTPVVGPYVLSDGDVIELGDSTLVLHAPMSASSPAPTEAVAAVEAVPHTEEPSGQESDLAPADQWSPARLDPPADSAEATPNDWAPQVESGPAAEPPTDAPAYSVDAWPAVDWDEPVAEPAADQEHAVEPGVPDQWDAAPADQGATEPLDTEAPAETGVPAAEAPHAAAPAHVGDAEPDVEPQAVGAGVPEGEAVEAVADLPDAGSLEAAPERVEPGPLEAADEAPLGTLEPAIRPWAAEPAETESNAPIEQVVPEARPWDLASAEPEKSSPAPEAGTEPAPAAASAPATPAPAVPALEPPPPAAEDAAALVTRHQMLDLGDGAAVAELAPVGALSIELADRFRALCDDLLAAGVTRYLFDLGHLDYLDSTGLAAVLRLSRDARSRGGQVCFFNETEAVRSIFELTNLRRVLFIVPDRATALAKLQEQSR